MFIDFQCFTLNYGTALSFFSFYKGWHSSICVKEVILGSTEASFLGIQSMIQTALTKAGTQIHCMDKSIGAPNHYTHRSCLAIKLF